MAVSDTLGIVGKTIAEKYAVEKVVGEGGCATVYRATHIIWKRPVALKVFKALSDFTATDRSKLLEGFVQEGALLADLSARSAAICQARDIGMLKTPRGDEIPYMVLEWLEGATLDETIEREKAAGATPRTVDQAVRLLEPAAEALAIAHSQGVAHRDVKPANIFLLGDPRSESCPVKILDFGIAKVVSEAQRIAGTFTKTGGQVTAFTPAYGAPEQFSRTHGATGPWTDVFALALVMVEMITGRAPLEGDDFVQLAVCAADPGRRPTPNTLGANVPAAVEVVFKKALAVKPQDRYQTVGEFWNGLRGALHMAPLRGFTLPAPLSTRGAPSGSMPASDREKVESARTIVATADPATYSPPASARSRGKGGLVAAIGGVAALGAAAAVYFLVIAPKGASSTTGAAATTPASTVTLAPSTSAAPAASAAAPKSDRCPDEMARIPGGRFFMGSEDGLASEKPTHQVTLQAYCMDKREVTVAEYKACSDTGGCLRASTTNDWPDISADEHAAYDPLCTIRDPETKGKHPINCVTWDQASKYCKEHGKRLPTEAEWEFAARGPDGRKYPWGDQEPTGELLNACGTECITWAKKWKMAIITKTMFAHEDGHAGTAPVGSYPKGASPYGLLDVVGNVWEWTSDWYGAYGKDELTDPKGPPEGERRVIRGGAWNAQYASWVRPTFRYSDLPTTKSHGYGFRCASQ